jgi:hypothetical protein
MSIGPDIKEVFQEVGVQFTILRDSGDVDGGYLHYHINRQVTKPFIREFFLEAFFPYDTSAVPGDVVKFNQADDVYMVMNKTPQFFEDSVIQNHAVLYKCNVSGELLRVSGEAWDENYQMSGYAWETIKSPCYALQTEALYGHDLETDAEIGLLGLENHELYVPKTYGARVLDRYRPVSGEVYRVETMKTRRYQAVDVLEVGEDTR